MRVRGMKTEVQVGGEMTPVRTVSVVDASPFAASTRPQPADGYVRFQLRISDRFFDDVAAWQIRLSFRVMCIRYRREFGTVPGSNRTRRLRKKRIVAVARWYIVSAGSCTEADIRAFVRTYVEVLGAAL